MSFFQAVASSRRIPTTSVSIVTSDIIQWFEPTLLNGTTWENKSYADGYNTSVPQYGTLVNGAGEATDPNGVKACYFDGVNDRANLHFNTYKSWYTIDSNNTGWTIECWVRSNGNWLSNGNIWNSYQNSGIRCRTTSTGSFNYAYIKGGTAHTVGTLSTNSWYQIVTTYDPSVNKIKTYFNNSLITDQSSGWQPDSWIGGTCYIGGYNSSQESGRFYMSTFRVYERPLSASEISQNYNADKSYHGL